MKKYLILTSLFFSIKAYAVTVPAASSVFQGGFATGQSTPTIILPTANLSNRKMIEIVNNSGSSGNYYNLYTLSGSSATLAPGQYQVPSGKTTYCSAALCTSSVLSRFQFGYSVSPQSDNNASAPGGARYFGSGASYFGVTCNTASSSAYTSIPVYYVFPAQSFPFAQLTTGGSPDFSIFLDCIEQ